jgi:hypothetical protein
MQCKELESVLADSDLGPLSSEARAHLAGCSACRDLLADLSAIVSTARDIPAEVNPPERIWVALRAQLEAEGVIRDVEIGETIPAPWWHGLAQFFRPRVLAPAAAALVVVASSIYVMEHRGHSPNNSAPTTIADVSKSASPETASEMSTSPSTAAVVVLPRHDAPTQSAHVPAPQARPSTLELRPSPSENMRSGTIVSDGPGAVLSATENDLPTQRLAGNAAVDAALRQNLRTLNEFITECEARLKSNPQDQLTREYLNMAYQQKAELLSAMMDSGRSEN